MKNYNWVDKYSPKKFIDLVANREAASNIYILLQIFENNDVKGYNRFREIIKTDCKLKKKKKYKFRKCILVTGEHGIGKTSTVKMIIKYLNYNLLSFDNNSNINLETVMTKSNKRKSIANMLNNEISKTLVYIDELESFSSKEGTKILTIMKKKKLNNNPIIIISNNNHSKLLTEIKKIAIHIKFEKITKSAIEKIYNKITIKEKINIKNKKIKKQIIDLSLFDIRQMINMLQDLHNFFDTKEITEELFNKYIKYLNKKDIKSDIYLSTKHIIHKYMNITDCLKYYNTDKVLVPLMTQQYCLNYIDTIDIPILEQYELLDKLSDFFATGDIIENNIYSYQNWNLHEIHGLFTCVFPSFHLSQKKKGKEISLKFAKDLHKTSIKKINKKNIIKATKCFKNMSIHDYIYLTTIIKGLLNDEKKMEECSKIFRAYNVKKEHLDSLLKIDKINKIEQDKIKNLIKNNILEK